MQLPDPAGAPCNRQPCAGSEIGAGPAGTRLILGAVLAGGRSRRFGADKAVAVWHGVALLDHSASAIAAVTDAVVVCGRDWPGLSSLADRPTGGLGPLGGINAALAEAARRGFSSIVTTGCDMPTIPSSLLEALVDAAPAFLQSAPILGCWPVELGPLLDTWLAAVKSAAQIHPAGVEQPGSPGSRPVRPDRSIRSWAAACGARPIYADTALPNVNTPADLPPE